MKHKSIQIEEKVNNLESLLSDIYGAAMRDDFELIKVLLNPKAATYTGSTIYNQEIIPTEKIIYPDMDMPLSFYPPLNEWYIPFNPLDSTLDLNPDYLDSQPLLLDQSHLSWTPLESESVIDPLLLTGLPG